MDARELAVGRLPGETPDEAPMLQRCAWRWACVLERERAGSGGGSGWCRVARGSLQRLGTFGRGRPGSSMSGEALLVFVVLGVTIVLFVSDRLRLDLVALLALLSLLVTGVLTPAEGFAGFADSAVITIAALFVVGAAMLHTGLAERFGRAIGRVAGTSRARLTAVLMLGTAAISAFVSTTGTVALMLPV